jgi:uncharacterized membrane protein YeaQ/YmgE (transglycosylase-associated protein family)
MGILWTIIIGFVAGVVAKFLMPGPNEPSGFILTTILGIVGAFVASYLGQALGWYAPGEGAGLVGLGNGIQKPNSLIAFSSQKIGPASHKWQGPDSWQSSDLCTQGLQRASSLASDQR